MRKQKIKEGGYSQLISQNKRKLNTYILSYFKNIAKINITKLFVVFPFDHMYMNHNKFVILWKILINMRRHIKIIILSKLDKIFIILNCRKFVV